MVNLIIDWWQKKLKKEEKTKEEAGMLSLSRIPPDLIARAEVGRMQRSDEICGELNPGFNLWTSAHGFHHFSLSAKKGWRRTWGAILFLCCTCLLLCFIFYSYQTFSSAVYSRVSLERISGNWPRTYICDRSGFSRRALAQASIGSRLIAYLTWSFSPNLAVPGSWNNSRLNMAGLEQELQSVLSTREQYQGDYNVFISSLLPQCDQVILECQIGREAPQDGQTCCQQLFDPKPHLTEQGTCFAIKSQFPISAGLTVTTQHEQVIMDSEIASQDMLSAQGIAFAVVDSSISPGAALRTHGVTVQPDTFATIGISPTKVDNTDLSISLIGRQACFEAGDHIDSHLNMNQGEFGYSRENCMYGKVELLVTSLLDCSFILTNTSTQRCSPVNSNMYSSSFLTTPPGSPNPLEISSVSGLQNKLDEECPEDCLQTRYSISPILADLSDSVKQGLRDKVPAGAGVNAIVLKFYMSSMDYTVIKNRPQPFLQFVAEIGGIMAFFLGISVITLIECCCYCGFCIKRKCVGDGPAEVQQKRGPPVRGPESETVIEQERTRWTEEYKREMQERAQQLEANASRYVS